MRSLERNKQTIYYAKQAVSTPIMDEFGNDTGEMITVNGNPVKYRIRVSPSRGETEEKAFGKSLDYDRVLYTADKKFPIDEFSRLWIDVVPIIKEDGSTDTPHDYKVVGVSKDLNEWLFAVKKVI